MKRIVLALAAMLAASAGVAQIRPHAYPQWFQDAKLGIMVHYGLYSIPSYSGREQYSEWFYKGLISNDTNRINFQRRVYSENLDYFDYMSMFRAEMFDADEWMELFRKAGARYFVFTTKHHDGFCLYPSKFTEYDVFDTPAGRDIVGELCTAARKRNMHVGLYYSLTEWTNPLFRWTIDTDTNMLERYVTEHMLPQFREIVDSYRPELVFSDGDWDFTYKQLHTEEMVNYLYDRVGENAIVNNRLGNGLDHGFLTPEYSSGIHVTDRPWAECRSVARSFALNRASPLEDYMTSAELIRHFCILVSGGGGLMLNVSPSADGHIPLLQQERLMDLGRWLEVNGEAIYGAESAGVPPITHADTLVRIDSVIDFDWVRNGPARGVSEDNFTIMWTGRFTVDRRRDYTFHLDADDMADMYLRRTSDSGFHEWHVRSWKSPSERTFALEPGEYEVVVQYNENDVDAHCSLHWSADGMERAPMRVDGGWRATIVWRTPSVCFTKRDGYLYAIVLNPNYRMEMLPWPYHSAPTDWGRLLGTDYPLYWRFDANVASTSPSLKAVLFISRSKLVDSDLGTEFPWVFRFKL